MDSQIIVDGLETQTQKELLALLDPVWRKVIVLSGVTGVGKTELSLELAERLNGEIISADSIQVYRGMDIGTAKVSLEEQKRIPHHLIDIRECTESFNVVDFYHLAQLALQDILSRGKVPIVVGGTGFYVHTLLYGPPAGPPSHAEVRATLQDEARTCGIQQLYDRLCSCDPLYAKKITHRDEHKIIRALEIIQITGCSVSSFSWQERQIQSHYHFLCYFLHKPREILYPILENRCEQMLEKGFLQEVVELDRLGIRTNPTARQAIGYKQALEFLETGRTEVDYLHFIKEFKTASRHLAKRQYTWFRKEPLFTWVDLEQQTRAAFLDEVVFRYSKEL